MLAASKIYTYLYLIASVYFFIDFAFQIILQAVFLYFSCMHYNFQVCEYDEATKCFNKRFPKLFLNCVSLMGLKIFIVVDR